MPSVSAGMLLVGLLVALGVASSRISARLGLPVLGLFIGVGMAAGSEGLGGVAFEDYGLANGVGTVALALILFNGGLQTSLASVRTAWRPALSLSTVGVALTAGLTGLAAAWVLGIPLLHGMLLGGIVGSTDAAAVFSVLRSSGLKLPDRLGATLEVESGSNDPMALFLTVGLTGLAAGTADSAGALALLLVLQFGVGSAVGLGVGRAASWVVERAKLDAPGLYPVLAAAFGLVAFGGAAVLGGSGFLAVYVAGIVLGNGPLVFRRGTLLVLDATAWLAQIALFILLGLLSFPSRLLEVAPEGFLIALVLVFVARPVAVAASVLPFGFDARAIAFLSWGGLKGAVPITLATFPLLAGVEGAALLFDVVFFVVLVSALAQGWSLSAVARWLGIGSPADPAPPVRVEIHALRHLTATSSTTPWRRRPAWPGRRCATSPSPTEPPSCWSCAARPSSSREAPRRFAPATTCSSLSGPTFRRSWTACSTRTPRRLRWRPVSPASSRLRPRWANSTAFSGCPRRRGRSARCKRRSATRPTSVRSRSPLAPSPTSSDSRSRPQAQRPTNRPRWAETYTKTVVQRRPQTHRRLSARSPKRRRASLSPPHRRSPRPEFPTG